MRRLLVTLVLAHLAGSYAMLLGLHQMWGPPSAGIWLMAPVLSPAMMWEVTATVLGGEAARRTLVGFGRPWLTLAAADGGYALAFGVTFALSFTAQRKSLRKRRRSKGLCGECGYDLTGNVSGKCPECGVHVNPKARLMVRRGG